MQQEVFKDESTTISIGDGMIRIRYIDPETNADMITQLKISSLVQALVKITLKENKDGNNSGN